ncbi:predicted protein [Naegleria gruberi]|uniref:Predicted protein n=1 Tax=Naegleria gruberi TaxID=5762 RepID=D2VMB1_NAEGR|nr:uncharacterized protein NAEGRDRAFT_50730 [Naegleria gruberi]EFC41957.1 predicted protein [Naegleria gruberi]|eukprot:XP_002674701.1 predicted protein [Naegleria gruberi strain NEG-M]
MSLKFDWNALTPELTKSLREQLNSKIEQAIFKSHPNGAEQDDGSATVYSSVTRSNINGLEISPNQALSYLIVESLDLGASGPNIQIKDIQQAPDEKLFLQRAKYYENKIYSKLYPANNNQKKPEKVSNVDVSKTMRGNNDDNVSVASIQQSTISSLLVPSPMFMASMQHRKRLGLSSTTTSFSPLAQNSLLMASGNPYYPMSVGGAMSDVYSVTTGIEHVGGKPITSSNLNSLRKAPLKTHLCSIGTIYKVAPKSDLRQKKEQLVQTKRRSAWWKDRVTNMENRREVNNFIPPVQILNNGSDKLALNPVDLKDANLMKEKLFDLGFLLSGKRNGKGGVKVSCHLSYSGNASIKIASEIRINLPIPGFITIPIEIELTRFIFDGDLTVIFYHNGSSKENKVLVYFENPVLPSFDVDEAKVPTQFNDQKLMANYIIKSTGEYSPLKEFNITVKVGASLSRESLPSEGEDKILEDKTEISNFVKELVHKVVKDLLIYPNVFTQEIEIPEE